MRAARSADRRGTSNRNARGSSTQRRARRQWLIQAWRADVDLYRVTRPSGMVEVNPWPRDLVNGNTEAWVAAGAAVEALPACRCYRCGILLTEDTVSPDRIQLGVEGGTYKRDNIRPCCLPCQMATGGSEGGKRVQAKARVKVETSPWVAESTRNSGCWSGWILGEVAAEDWMCEHKHQTEPAALACARKEIRARCRA